MPALIMKLAASRLPAAGRYVPRAAERPCRSCILCNLGADLCIRKAPYSLCDAAFLGYIEVAFLGENENGKCNDEHDLGYCRSYSDLSHYTLSDFLNPEIADLNTMLLRNASMRRALFTSACRTAVTSR
jgi:hypothetical protein